MMPLSKRTGVVYIGKTVKFLLLAGFVVFALFPVFWMFETSVKQEGDILTIPPPVLFTPTLESYRTLFEFASFQIYVVNSVVVTLGSTALSLLVSIPAAYALARFRFKRNRDVFVWILSARTFPAVAAVLPLTVFFVYTGMLGSYLTLILTYPIFIIPFCIWMLVGFFSEIPEELEEAALIDGCSRFPAFLRVTLPLAASGLAATAVLSFLFAWNEFMFSLTFTSSQARTLPAAATQFITYSGILWGPMTAASVIIAIPIVVLGLIVQRYLVAGLTMGAIRG